MTIIQYNINGAFNNFSDLQLLSKKISTLVICLQETHLTKDKNFSLRNFNIISNKNTKTEPNGGCAILIREGINFTELNLRTNLDTVAIRTTLLGGLTICSIYLSPSIPINLDDLNDLILNLPEPFIIIGDFNAHNTLWGSCNNNTRGRTIENFVNNNSLQILNTGGFTYLHPGHKTFSAIDLAICSPSIYHKMTWHVEESQYNSDHFPIEIILPDMSPDLLRRTRWKEDLANWKLFSQKISSNLKNYDNMEVNDAVQSFTSLIQNAASNSIPLTNPNPKAKTVPWWNTEINSLKKECDKAYKKFKRMSTDENYTIYRNLKNKYKHAIENSKKKTWNDYVASIDNKTSVKEMFHKIKKISGTFKTQQIYQISHNSSLVSEPNLICETLAQQFYTNCDNTFVNPNFENRKSFLENLEIEEPTSQTPQELNEPFSMQELESVISSVKGKSPGPDSITYNMIKNLDVLAKVQLLRLYNRIFKEKVFPDEWRKANIVPIQKPNKDPTNPENYRPISLTNCLSKILEKMVVNRLNWWLEKNKFLSKNQSGFRNHRSTTDNLVHLQEFVSANLQKKNHVSIICFDITKAYEKTWRILAVHQLAKWNLSGEIFEFIKQFLSQRFFRVLYGHESSDWYEQVNGMVTGSVLSVPLFLISIHGVTEILEECQNVNFTIYADDLTIYSADKDEEVVSLNLQNAISKIENWANDNGILFSSEKTCAMNFCTKRNCPSTSVKIYNEPIRHVNETKILGVIFDSKLSFKQHLENLRLKINNVLKLIKTLSNTRWGARQKPLLKIVESLMLSRIDYGSQAYGQARNSILKTIDPPYHTALRLSVGGFKSSPITSILAISGFPSLHDRRNLTNATLFYKIKNNPENPNFQSLQNISLSNKFPEPFSTRGLKSITALNVGNFECKITSIPNYPFWISDENLIDFSLSRYKKEETHPLEYNINFQLKMSEYNEYEKVYTDGSKGDFGTGYSIVMQSHDPQCIKIPDFCSIFFAEASAILDACNLPLKEDSRRLIITDSLSVLKAVQNCKNKEPIIVDIRDNLHKNNNIKLFWCPSHCGIKLNEEADKAAKQATKKMFNDNQICSYKDIKHYITDQWNKIRMFEWNEIPQHKNKSRRVKDNPFGYNFSEKHSRRDEIIINRLKLGHTNITHNFLMNKSDPPICEICQVQITVEHILIHCKKYEKERNEIRLDKSLQNILKEDFSKECKLLKFLNKINLQNEI